MVSGGDGTYQFPSVKLSDPFGISTEQELTDSWIIYVPAVSAITGTPVSGAFVRLKITSIESVFDWETFTYKKTINAAWDEKTSYSDRALNPSASAAAVVVESSSNWALGYAPTIAPSQVFEGPPPAGVTLSSRASDIDRIIDQFGQGGGGDSDLTFDGNRTVKRSGLPAVNAGGETVTEWLNNYFFPFLAATVSLTPLPTYQIGTSQNVTLAGSVTLNDETEVFARRVLDVTSGSTIIGNPAGNTIIFTVQNVIASRSFKIDVDVGGNGTPNTISSPTRTVQFVYPFLHGMSSNPSLDNFGLYSQLAKLIETRADKTIVLSGSTSYVYFAYPASYPDLTGIYDQNGFNTLPSFTLYQAPVTSVGLNYSDWTQTYKVYRSKLITSVDSQPFRFTF